MRLDPAVGGKVHGDAGGEEADADAEGTDDPAQLDAALEHEVVEDAEDQDKHGGFREESRAAAGGDDREIEETGAGSDVVAGGSRHQTQVG